MANVKRTPVATLEQIIAARGERTQVEVATLLEVSRRTVQNWESGYTPISKAQYQALLALAAR